jgi:MtN3 and saliva related transmembrane protein
MDDWLPLGLVAGLLTTLGFVPQIIKSLRTRRMDEVSLLMPLLLAAGLFLWLLYGVVKEDPPIIIWNAISLALNLSLVGLKVFYGRKHRRDREESGQRSRDILSLRRN